MSLRFVRFVVVMLAALSLSVSVGHFMQLPARMAWDQYLWVGSTVQGGLYRLAGPLGVLIEVATLIALVVLTFLLRRQGGSFALTVAAAALFATGLIFWWALVYPVNVELATWVNGAVPPNWMEWRALWEWGQSANAIAQLAGFAALVASLLVNKGKRMA